MRARAHRGLLLGRWYEYLQEGCACEAAMLCRTGVRANACTARYAVQYMNS